ncbi:MAG TPA: hypothetical protein VM925_10450 [Labilithrix sp.]|nr:hypothetical protein [Labilithrix sp.]
MRGQRLMRCLLAVGVVLTSVGAGNTSRADDAPAIADEQTMTEARKHFQAGVNLLDDPDGARYEDAYIAFHKAFALSKSPKVLGNIGFCALKLERDGEAIDAYTTYLRESRDVDPRERAQIERDLATLASSVATFKVVVQRPAESFVVVDTRIQTRGSPVVNSYPFKGPETTLRLRPGRHSLKVKTNDAESRTYEVSIEAASQGSHEFTFAPPPSAVVIREAAPSSPSYAGPIFLGIVGLAALGTGTVTGLMARAATDDIQARCPNDVCPASYDLQGHRSEAKTLSTIADATFVGGGVALGGALLWTLLTPSSRATKTPRTGSIAWQPGARCSGRGCGVEIGGAF